MHNMQLTRILFVVSIFSVGALTQSATPVSLGCTNPILSETLAVADLDDRELCTSQ